MVFLRDKCELAIIEIRSFEKTCEYFAQCCQIAGGFRNKTQIFGAGLQKGFDILSPDINLQTGGSVECFMDKSRMIS